MSSGGGCCPAPLFRRAQCSPSPRLGLYAPHPSSPARRAHPRRSSSSTSSSHVRSEARLRSRFTVFQALCAPCNPQRHRRRVWRLHSNSTRRDVSKWCHEEQRRARSRGGDNESSTRTAVRGSRRRSRPRPRPRPRRRRRRRRRQ